MSLAVKKRQAVRKEKNPANYKMNTAGINCSHCVALSMCMCVRDKWFQLHTHTHTRHIIESVLWLKDFNKSLKLKIKWYLSLTVPCHSASQTSTKYKHKIHNADKILYTFGSSWSTSLIRSSATGFTKHNTIHSPLLSLCLALATTCAICGLSQMLYVASVNDCVYMGCNMDWSGLYSY